MACNDNDISIFINFPIKIDEHEHPLLLCNCQKNNNDNWACNKCSSNYTSCIPSFYCTYCDYNLCQKCLGELKLNQIKRSDENIIIFNNYNMLVNNNSFTWQKKTPSHIHSLTLIRRVNNNSWICDNCNQTYKNNAKLLFYCSLCDYNLCTKCYMNKNTIKSNGIIDYDYKYPEYPRKTIPKRKRISHIEDMEFFYQDQDIKKKPVIYLYPEKEMDISVQLNINDKDNELTTIYPKFNGESNTWNVHAQPNGDIKLGNKTYPYLFWEAKSYYNQEINEGFIVEDKNAEEFLENKLKILGLNDKESTDFITFWLPVLLRNKLSLCNFQSEQFFNNFKLNVNPKPDTMIRIFLTIKKIDYPIEIKEQKLEKNERKGYTLIEWGGCDK